MIFFICAHCGAIAEFADDEILLDTGYTLLCTCGGATIVELRPNTASSLTVLEDVPGDESGTNRAAA